MKLFFNTVLFFATLTLMGCGAEDDPEPENCDNNPQVAVTSTTATSTCNASDGKMIVEGGGGVEPLEYSIDGDNFQTSNEFTGLAAGTYEVIVRDAKGCLGEVQAVIDPGDTDLAASVEVTADTECLDDNGTVEVSATGGETPYEYNIGNGFTTSATFSSLASGDYELIVKDGVGCMVTIAVSVSKGDTGTSYQNDVGPIIMTSCAISGCHNGDNGSITDFTNFGLVQNKADEIKRRTQNGSMPQTGSITEEEKALIACWVDEGAKDN